MALKWQPKDVSSTHMDAFRRYINERYGKDFGSYAELYAWSCDDIDAFWSAAWDYLEIHASAPYTQVVEHKPMPDIPQWFIGARLNYAENILARYRDSDRIAIIATGEQRGVQKTSFRELHEQVRLVANAMRRLGIGEGDRIAAYIANCTEAVVVMLATASVGAIYSSTSLDFGTTAVLDRFSQIGPKLLFSVDTTVYNGKRHSHLAKLREVVGGLSTIERVIVIPFDGGSGIDDELDPSLYMNWKDFMHAPPQDSEATNTSLEFAQLPFSAPLYILYSSGTTGKPKCLVHSGGGMLIQHLKEHRIHQSLGEGDVVFYYTTTGWMMWNWLVSVLGVGATIVLYEGSPLFPNPGVLWRLVDELNITVFGTSARYIQALEDQGYRPRDHFSLHSLHSIYSTASPLKPNNYDFVYDHVKPNVCLASITGGTDICSLFCGANTALPVYRGEIQCRNLGMAVESFGVDGRPVYDSSGDMICVKPFPCMPVMLWNDPANERYLKTYFSHYPGVWYHGDYICIRKETGGVVMLGRSDSTLNPSGVRFGSSELYNVVDSSCPEVEDSLVVGQQLGADERVLMFVKMAPGRSFGSAIVDQIKQAIRSQLSPRHVPACIFPIDDIPYTVNGKKVEVAVKTLISELYRVAQERGGPEVARKEVKVDPKTVSTLINPQCLSQFYQYDALFK
ncbi:hypothetical protein EV182_002377 [Spiromyces aspiralis]|uniref:Uncharacterized protein n=1 Tax=Spiromyces aspiralis TaxID=68401 RepID=A0ACC1HFU0_9FUNG|nr:hypothetical protein EV182_002377 [Spiromyces aspiralis]